MPAIIIAVRQGELSGGNVEEGVYKGAAWERRGSRGSSFRNEAKLHCPQPLNEDTTFLSYTECLPHVLGISCRLQSHPKSTFFRPRGITETLAYWERFERYCYW
jgi:hypothetical protein